MSMVSFMKNIFHNNVDISKAIKILNYEPKISFEESI